MAPACVRRSAGSAAADYPGYHNGLPVRDDQGVCAAALGVSLAVGCDKGPSVASGGCRFRVRGRCGGRGDRGGVGQPRAGRAGGRLRVSSTRPVQGPARSPGCSTTSAAARRSGVPDHARRLLGVADGAADARRRSASRGRGHRQLRRRTRAGQSSPTSPAPRPDPFLKRSRAAINRTPNTTRPAAPRSASSSQPGSGTGPPSVPLSLPARWSVHA